MGFQLQAGLSTVHQTATTAGAAGLTAQANMYDNQPARYFRYDNVRYKISVEIVHQKYAAPSLLHWGGKALGDAAVSGLRAIQARTGAVSAARSASTPRPADDTDETSEDARPSTKLPTGIAVDDTLRGGVTFVLPEAMAREEREQPRVVGEVGRVLYRGITRPPAGPPAPCSIRRSCRP